MVCRVLTNYDLIYHPKSELDFLFPLSMMMEAEGGVFPRGRSGSGLGPAKGSIFGGLHVLLFHSSLAHQKSGRRDLEQLGGHHLMVAQPETESSRLPGPMCYVSLINMTDQAFSLTWISASPVIVICLHVWVVACDLCTTNCILYSTYLLLPTLSAPQT